MKVLVIQGLFCFSNKHWITTAYTLNNPNVIRLEPLLVITKQDIDTLLNALEDVLLKNKGAV